MSRKGKAKKRKAERLRNKKLTAFTSMLSIINKNKTYVIIYAKHVINNFGFIRLFFCSFQS